jgi:DNA polymerase V
VLKDNQDWAVWIWQIYTPNCALDLRLPQYSSAVPAGFPSPADDHLEGNLDLNAHLIKHPHATFFTRVSGDSMTDAGIHSGDLLIVDRSLEPSDGQVVVAALDGELTVKRLLKRRGKVYLQAANPDYPPLQIHAESECIIWGVVTHAIHAVR